MKLHNALAGLLSLLLLATAATAQKDSGSAPVRRTVPLRLPPEFATITRVDAENGALQLRKIVLVAQTKEVTVTVRRDGRDVQEKQLVSEQTPAIQDLRIDVGKSRFINGRGEKVASKKVMQKLEEGQVILLCWDVNGVEESVRKVLAPEAFILMPKEAASSEGPREKKEPKREGDSER